MEWAKLFTVSTVIKVVTTFADNEDVLHRKGRFCEASKTKLGWQSIENNRVSPIHQISEPWREMGVNC